MKFVCLIIGTDANAYYMSRCYYETYHQKAYILGNKPLPFTSYSSISNIIYNDKIWDEKEFIKALNNFKRIIPKNVKILVISSNETYTNYLNKFRNKLDRQFVYNYNDENLINSLIMKDIFYQKYKDSNLDFAKTIIYDCHKYTKFKSNIMYPVIIKPSDVIEYNHLNFDGKKKIYKLYNIDEVNEVLKMIVKSGYKNNLIIQEYIPGDDSYLFDSVVYSNSKKEVKLVTFAQIGLQEHSKNMIGNAAVLINGYSQFEGKEKMIENIKTFLESIKYEGFAEFDMKYDKRDNKFKVLEINARQGRSSYYLSMLGYNLVKVMADDLIYNKKMDYKYLDKEVILSFIPKGVFKKYCVNNEYKNKALSLWKGNINPLNYRKDINIKMKLYLIKKYFR